MKPGVRTSEFVALVMLVVLFVLKAAVLPNLSEEVFYILLGWIGLRQATKGISGYMETKSTDVPPSPQNPSS